MNEHRFILQPYRSKSSRFYCPLCQDSRSTFTRYIDLETNLYLADHVGRCDREDNCGYHFTPRQYFAENPYDLLTRQIKVCNAMPVKDLFNHLPTSLVKESMMEKAYAHNNFILFLDGVFGRETTTAVARRYKIGTSKHWYGATVFWQVDTTGCVRTGKIMLYDPYTGKRVKQPFNHIAWVHSLLGKSGRRKAKYRNEHKKSAIEHPNSEFQLRQCFFGEHLLREDEEAIVAIAESEKTALMASVMMPEFIWLAAGSLNGLDEDKCRVLHNRTVLLFPDVGCYKNWAERAHYLNLKIPTATFTVHPEMETTATAQERATGADMGDRWIAEWLEMKGQHYFNRLVKRSQEYRLGEE